MSMHVNDRDVTAEFKLITSVPKGFVGPPPRQDSLVPVPGRVGHMRLSGESDTGPRRFTIEAVMKASSAAEARTLWDAFVRLVSGEEIEVWFSDWPDLVGKARYEEIDTQDRWHVFHARRFTMTFVMPNPQKLARQVDVYAIDNGLEVPLELGSASSDIRLRVVSIGASSPQVLYLNAQGEVAGDVSFPLTATSFPTGQWLDYNWDGYHLARRWVSTPPEVDDFDVAPVYGSPFGPFVADPDDGDATQGPSLRAVNCNVICELRKAWL